MFAKTSFATLSRLRLIKSALSWYIYIFNMRPCVSREILSTFEDCFSLGNWWVTGGHLIICMSTARSCPVSIVIMASFIKRVFFITVVLSLMRLTISKHVADKDKIDCYPEKGNQTVCESRGCTWENSDAEVMNFEWIVNFSHLDNSFTRENYCYFRSSSKTSTWFVIWWVNYWPCFGPTPKHLLRTQSPHARKLHLKPPGGTQQMFIRGGSASKSNPWPFYIPFFTNKVPLSYTFYWKMVPLSHTLFRTLHPF